MPVGNIREVERVDCEYIPADACPICPKCLKPCHPLQHYCNECDSNDAINPFAPYMPFLNIRFNYGIFLTMWQRVFSDKDTSVAAKLFYLCMLTMFVPVFLVIGLPLLLIFRIPQSKSDDNRSLHYSSCVVDILFLLRTYH